MLFEHLTVSGPLFLVFRPPILGLRLQCFTLLESSHRLHLEYVLARIVSSKPAQLNFIPFLVQLHASTRKKRHLEESTHELGSTIYFPMHISILFSYNLWLRRDAVNGCSAQSKIMPRSPGMLFHRMPACKPALSILGSPFLDS
ncbi:hypothetical protein BKA66DRAFT_312425 [Pyrenochaeta sp. MPI-SDFR-AT-0127]|nr:hypothetical protein BKA66DRAFT_312425 [Pyrenochaeta sp. MPI-SDFR-AT-0127]